MINLNDVSALIIGDPHFKISNVAETDAMVEAIKRIALARKPDIIVVLGDVLDRHETIHVCPFTRAIDFLAFLMTIAPVYLLIGNHDLKNNRQFLSDEHPFRALKYWHDRADPHKSIIVVDTTTKAIIKNQVFIFVPYTPCGRFLEALNTCPGWEAASCIFAHQEFKGAQMGAFTSVEGDEWPLINPYIISGHIHDYQELQSNILYPGTPIQHTFGDNSNKRITYAKFRNINERSSERVDLGLPKKFIVHITCQEVSGYKPTDNSQLKIVIRGSSGDIKYIMKHPNIDVWKRQGHKITYKDITVTIGTEPVLIKAPPRFSTALYNSVSNDQRLLPLYKQIFGDITLK